MKVHIPKSIVVAALFTTMIACSTSELTRKIPPTPPSPSQSLGLDNEIALDPKITKGKFDNGLTYYIRKNEKPERRAELRLVVNAGSVLEEEDQRGLAHFLEHMAFNGTARFKKQEIINFMELAGMPFGSHLNAYTSFDETVYMLTVPTDRDSLLEKGFQILADWASQISLEDEEIDKERGVIREEWRLGRGAEMRIQEKEFQVIFWGSLYAERHPIGQIAVIDTFHYDTLRKFYRDWYRPDLMAVIAVGDFDEDRVKNLIEQNFIGLKSPADAPPRPIPPVPDHTETLFSIQTDPELTRNQVDLLIKLPRTEQKYIRDYRQSIVENLYNSMLNERLEELTKTAEPPFLGAASQKGRLVRSKDCYSIGAVVKDNGIEEGFTAILTELKRVREFGFTETELKRAKSTALRNMEQIYRERDKIYSRSFASEYIRNFLDNEPVPGIELEYEFYKKYVPEIALPEVNVLAKEWVTDINRVVLVSAPEKPDLKIPTETELREIFEKVERQEVTAYIDEVAESDLVRQLPPPGRILQETLIDSLDLTELILSNGVKVIIKPTDFKNDEILLSAYSPGGTSLVPDSNYVAAISSVPIVTESGLGEFNSVMLSKKLAGKVVSVQPSLAELTENFSASASPEDLETMFQLIYLYFTAPRKDSTAYLSYLEKLKNSIVNRAADPFAAFSDTIRVTLSQYHFRARPWTIAMLDEIDLNKSYNIFRDRFGEAGDFTFFLIGNVELDSAKQMAMRYLANLPTNNREENWRDVGIRPPNGVVQKAVYKGLEKQSYVQITFSGNFDWSRQNRFELATVTDVLRIKLREQIREEKGGTYGIYVGSSSKQYPYPEFRLTIQFGCDPERVTELTSVIFQEIENLKSEPLGDEDLAKIRQIDLRSYETNLKENRFWLDNLHFYYFNNENPMAILHYPQLVEDLTKEMVQNAARRYLPLDNYVEVVLYPEQ
ncbi:MAG TPA: insulinase family protein [Candidatus Marinimicrobia bacterium]|nr:insulinase family protein [Candidatus Neomarinimicrobiota bacterium]